MATTEGKGGVNVKAQNEKAAKVVRDAQGGSYTLFGVGLDADVRAQQSDGYTQVGDMSIKTPKLNAASLKVMQNEAKSEARHALWRQHDAERAERVAKGKAILSKAVAQINAGIKAEDAKKHPLKAVHWNAKAGKAKWDPQDVAEVKDAQGNVTTKGSKAGTEYAAFKKDFEAWTKGLVVDPKTGKNSEGRMRYGDSGTMLQKYKDLGLVTYDKDGNQIVNWDKVTSQEQVDVLKGEMDKDGEFQGRMIAEQKQREAKIVSDARDYAKQNGVDLPKNATDAQVLRTVFADKAQKAADAVNEGDAGANAHAGRDGKVEQATGAGIYGNAAIVDAAGITVDSVGVAKDEAMAKGIEADDATIMKSTEAGAAGLGAMETVKTAVQKAATDANDAKANAGGDVADALAEQVAAGRAVNKAVQKSNDEAKEKIAKAKKNTPTGQAEEGAA